MLYKVVYTSGTFDLFHKNHLEIIKKAKGLGQYLIVGVSTDELVEKYKSPPIIPFEERITIIESLRYVDCVIPQHSLNHIELVNKLNIDCFVVGDDWYGKYDYLREYCDVKYFPYGKGISSSNLKKDIYEKYKELIKNTDKHTNPDPQGV